jgi:hypothetical protein
VPAKATLRAHRLSVIPKWQNVGETSATSLTFRINYQFSRDDLPLGFTSIDQNQLLEGPADVASKETLNVGGIRDANGAPLYYPQPCLMEMQQESISAVPASGSR